MPFTQKLFRLLALLILLFCQIPAGAMAQTSDVAGARDYPGIGRFGGSATTGYLVKDFDAARMQTAAFKDGQPAVAQERRRA